MKKYSYLILTLLIFSSCNDWFDVTSSSEIRKKDHYKNVKGFQQTLTGCYIGMTNDGLYGKTLSWHATEMMAHQYEKTIDESLKELYHYNYKAKEAIPVFEEVWRQSYNVIVNANDALENLEERKNSLHPIDYAVLKGEFLAVRAYLHFDLLRLYGYGNWANRAAKLDAKPSIPYVTKLQKDITPQSTGAELYRFILKDLDEAAALLLENDPITKKKKKSEYDEINSDGFYFYRDLHLNYYAVRALQARVHQWIGTPEAMAKALKAASEVIDFIENGGFKDIPNYKTEINFIPSTSLKPANYSLFTETLFGLNVNKLEDRVNKYIVPDFSSDNTYAFQILPARVEKLFENENLDVRFSKLLQQSVISTTKGYVSVKLIQRNLSPGNRDRVSLIRIPEVYYIAAEAQLSKGEAGVPAALRLLSTVRKNRGLFTPLKDLDLEKAKSELMKEYRKEFISEGVMFFVYKRLGKKEIPNLSDGQVMGDAQYVVPFPDFEIQSGRKQ